jgi:tripartite-type tricarboxylate transporter receptor subunit TctC
MTLGKRRLLAAMTLAPLAALAPSMAKAQASAYPQKPVRLVIPFPGGFTDTLARLVGQKMSEGLGQPVLVEQRPGGGGQLAAGEVLRAPADGHTLFLIHIGTHAINPHLQTKLNYHPEQDFVPISELARVPNLLVVSPSLPAGNVQELVALAKARPGTLFYASPGVGTSGHLAGELFKSLAGIEIGHVAYKGTAESLQDLMSGRVHLLFDTLAQSAPLARSGKLRGLAVTSAQRHATFPEFPTMSESGFAGWETGPWFGLAVRSGTPDEVVKRIHLETAKAMSAPAVRERLIAMGATPIGSSPEEFTAFIRSESARWGTLISRQGIKAE